MCKCQTAVNLICNKEKVKRVTCDTTETCIILINVFSVLVHFSICLLVLCLLILSLFLIFICFYSSETVDGAGEVKLKTGVLCLHQNRVSVCVRHTGQKPGVIKTHLHL